MAKEEKAQIINELENLFSRGKIAILTDYRGVNGPEMLDLHRKFREQGIEYRVVKNTLARIAAEKAGKGDLAILLKGQTAMVIGYDDITAPVKTLTEYIRASKTVLTIKGGILENRLLTVQDVNTLATLPPKEVLLTRVLGGMQLPMYALHSHLSGLLAGFARALQARVKQLEGG
ncbi:MAG: 50S ribosomal protein L10 [Chloroflexi bacterium]|nr:50S ribosomal protein L10 [Chloroflexota bacterium]